MNSPTLPEFFRTSRPTPSCLASGESLELNAAALRAVARSPLALHDFLERACADARRRTMRRIWVCASECDAELSAFLEQWGFLAIPEEASGAGERELRAAAFYVRGIAGTSASESRRIQKVDTPLDDDEAIRNLVARFEACTLPFEQWTHRAHLAVGVAYLRAEPLERALARLRRHIRLYNQSRGDPAGYHETITQLFLRKIAATDTTADSHRPSMSALVEHLSRECGVDWIYRYYTRERITSREARLRWVEPDLRPLDF